MQMIEIQWKLLNMPYIWFLVINLYLIYNQGVSIVWSSKA